MGCYFLLQGILLTQGIFESLEFLQGNFLNLLHWQVFSRHLQIKLTKDRLVRKDRFLYMYMCVGVHRKMWLKEVVRIVCMPAQWLQWCLTLCNPMDCSPPGFSVHRILQARVLEWVVIPSSRGSSQSRDLSVSPAWQADSYLLLSLSPGHVHIYLVRPQIPMPDKAQSRADDQLLIPSQWIYRSKEARMCHPKICLFFNASLTSKLFWAEDICCCLIS